MNINFRYYNTYLLISVVVILWGAISGMLSWFWNYGLLQGVAPITLIFAFLFVYDKWLWKYPILGLLVRVPNITGEYTGSVEYSLDGRKQSKACALEIRQSASHIKVRCTFGCPGDTQTTSDSKEALFTEDELGGYKLLFYYENYGSQLKRDILDPHYGFNILDVKRVNGEIRLEGIYFTNRNPQTRGNLTVVRKEET